MNKDEALKLALEALETLVNGNGFAPVGNIEKARKTITAIKQALAAQHEPENEPFVSLASVQEPVAWCSQCGHKCPQTVNQEPVGWWDDKLGFFEEKHFDQLRPLYTTPPAARRPWVGLTDEEWQDLSDRYGMILFGRFKNEIEDKLKEKNT
jgi:hypothetical protein